MPDRLLHYVVSLWNPETKSWVFLMEQKDQTRKWRVFAEDTLRRTES